jgi:ribosomal protein S18 acetylase RimI-like enzyme
MYSIRAAVASDLDEVVDMLARLQAEPAHHIAYHGETVEQITGELTSMRQDWTANAVLAIDSGGRPRGFLSVEADLELGKAWLHGPFIDVPVTHPAAAQLWHQTADAMLPKALAKVNLDKINDLELFGHRQHRLLADFAARHDFHTGQTSRVFLLGGAGLRSILVRGAADESIVDSHVRALPADPVVRQAVLQLHARCCMNGPVTGQQLIDGSRGHSVVVLADARGLIGYAAGHAQEGELYVDLVVIDPNRRGRGAGRSLVRGLLRELAARHGPTNRATATVALGNDASERMFTALGFAIALEVVSYRRRVRIGAIASDF